MAWANKTLKAEDIRYIVAHCSAGPITQKAEDIEAFHKKRWPSQTGMSYAYYIEADGTVRNGRPELSLGFHVGNLNDCAIGFCAAGGVDVHNIKNGAPAVLKNFTEAQYKSIASVALGLMARYPNAKLIGHNEVCSKACPVYDIHAVVRDATGRGTNQAEAKDTAADGHLDFWKTVKHFNSSEFEYNMDEDFILKLDKAREIAGIPFIVREAVGRSGCTIRATKSANIVYAAALQADLIADIMPDGVVDIENK